MTPSVFPLDLAPLKGKDVGGLPLAWGWAQDWELGSVQSKIGSSPVASIPHRAPQRGLGVMLRATLRPSSSQMAQWARTQTGVWGNVFI